MSVITFVFYGYDKRQFVKNKPRVPEPILHMPALLGGTPGALPGQLLFRHKTKKLRFRIVFPAIVLLQAGLGFCYLKSIKFDLIAWKGGSLKRQSLGDALWRLGMVSLVFTIPKAFGFEAATQLME